MMCDNEYVQSYKCIHVAAAINKVVVSVFLYVSDVHASGNTYQKVMTKATATICPVLLTNFFLACFNKKCMPEPTYVCACVEEDNVIS